MADGLSKKLPPWASDMAWPAAIPEKDRLRLKPEPVLKSYQPTSRDRIVGLMADYLYGGGQEGYQRADNAMNILDWTPVGTLNDAYDAGRAIGEGRYGDAALIAGPAILPGRSEHLVKKFRRGLPGKSLFGFKSKPQSGFAQDNFDGIVTRKAEDYRIYNPPDKPQRPFKSDYTNPDHAVSDASGKLLTDMDGRDLTAKQIIGRQTVDGPDVGATPDMDEAIAKDISGNEVQTVPRQNIDGEHGRSYFESIPGKPLKPKEIEIADDLPKAQKEMVTGHEVAHFIDEMAGQIPTDGLDDELRFIYNTTAIGKENARPTVYPENMGYVGADIQRELMTEAIRAYRVNPNWLKTVAPRTAARIREWGAKNPELSKITQFNSLAAGAGGLALAGQSKESEVREIPAGGRNQQSNILQAPYSILGPPVPFELVSGAAKSGSNGIAKIVDALIRRGIMPQTRGAGKFTPLARALLDIQARQKASVHGGPR